VGLTIGRASSSNGVRFEGGNARPESDVRQGLAIPTAAVLKLSLMNR